jgi:hypothetical protein
MIYLIHSDEMEARLESIRGGLRNGSKQRKERNRKKDKRDTVASRGEVGQETLQESRIFANIDEEGFGRPASGSLNDGRGDTMLGKCCGSPSAHRLACNVRLEEETQT